MKSLEGFMLLLYLFTAMASSTFAHHARSMSMAIAMSTIATLAALVLAVTLYALLRDHDESLAVLALSCWTGLAAINTLQTLALRMLLTLTASRLTADAFVSFVLRARNFARLPIAIMLVIGNAIFVQLFFRPTSVTEVSA